jgi:hypothetical protein
MRTARQLAIIAEVIGIAGAAEVKIWLRGGWAMDFYLGHITRDHTDIDFFTWAATADTLVAELAGHGYHSLTGPPSVQQRDLAKHEEEVSFALVDLNRSGEIVVAGGPWAGEPFPQAAPHNKTGRIGAVECAVVNPHGQIEIKQMTPVWNPNLRRRTKDATDIDCLKAALNVSASAAD